MRGTISFEGWKQLLRYDSIACGKLEAFEDLGEYVLMLLYENGLDPTVKSIVRDGLNGRPQRPIQL